MRAPVDPDNLPEGTMVDCWRVVRQLGGGAYGTVYLVEKDTAAALARVLYGPGCPSASGRVSDARGLQGEHRCGSWREGATGRAERPGVRSTRAGSR